jgi:hypothetical protein
VKASAQIALALAAALLGALSLAGCITGAAAVADAPPATDINPATTQPSYWYDQPKTAQASSGDFDRLWHASADAARDFLFDIDVRDYREGLLVTEPLVSGQWFEPWRRDARTIDDRLESSLVATRRTIRFEFARDGDGWTVTPKVLVERQAIAEKRITSVLQYRTAFMAPSRSRYRASGSAESDRGIVLPERYWYPTGRDATLEAALGRAIEQKLSHR